MELHYFEYVPGDEVNHEQAASMADEAFNIATEAQAIQAQLLEWAKLHPELGGLYDQLEGLTIRAANLHEWIATGLTAQADGSDEEDAE